MKYFWHTVINYIDKNAAEKTFPNKYKVIRWIRTQDQGCCELVLGLILALKASMWPQEWAQISFKSETLYNLILTLEFVTKIEFMRS